jgi:hypothetical protein
MTRTSVFSRLASTKGIAALSLATAALVLPACGGYEDEGTYEEGVGTEEEVYQEDGVGEEGVYQEEGLGEEGMGEEGLGEE